MAIAPRDGQAAMPERGLRSEPSAITLDFEIDSRIVFNGIIVRIFNHAICIFNRLRCPKFVTAVNPACAYFPPPFQAARWDRDSLNGVVPYGVPNAEWGVEW